ncbi:universal stress protein [Actinokineospora bangkokensis]|uniref:UspA domain-containing protein n=1 Tax=Actinokineospora bangkokensis TaxID=1193682 RepID=A0A1Q9LR32_9PSEU|nr:universal stress protein [Actinokineospora bangkokensis]OLR94480.1 hypothetical protein BJP25_12080 [Actinokineospora bangkokensis]
MSTNTVLVAVDGSPSATRAVRWAAHEAERRRAALRIATVHPWPITGYPPGLISGPELHEGLREGSSQVLRAAAAEASRTAPGTQVHTTALEGDVVSRLLGLSCEVDLVVLGSRGLGGISGMLLGSVAVGLTSRTATPVVVVRGAPERDTDLRVVVGVDGGPGDEAALRFAFDHAAATGRVLTAVHTWGNPALDGLALGGHPAVDWRPVAEHAQQVLDAALHPWSDKHPGVAVERVVRHSSPTPLLIEMSHHAGLVVVGSRGRGSVAGLFLGSTSQALVHHCACPVAVVRPEPVPSGDQR